MILPPDTPPGKPGVADDVYSDPRIDAFIDFIVAHDKRDFRMGIAASRRLRALGYSLCLIEPKVRWGGR